MRYRAILSLLLITQLLCVGCSGSLGGVINTQEGWSDAQVYQYYDKQSDIFGLLAQLKNDGYRYIPIPFTALPTFDPRVQPGNTLANGGGNCAAWVKLFSAFIEYTKSADEFFELQMVRGVGDGHMISIIRIGQKYYEQSNLHLTEYADYDTIIERWKQAGYKFIDVSKRWSK